MAFAVTLTPFLYCNFAVVMKDEPGDHLPGQGNDIVVGSSSSIVGVKVVGSLVQTCLPPQRDIGVSLVPAVVFSTDYLTWTVQDVQDVLTSFEEVDNVFQPAFAEGAFLIARFDGSGKTPTSTLDDSLTRFLDEKSSRLVFISANENDLPDGPYFVEGAALHWAWRLYLDDNWAFTLALAPSESGDSHTWEPLRAGAHSGLYPVITVPSRLHYPKSKEKPPNRLRITVKDNKHLPGIHTTLGSRSYIRLHGPQ
ncbi:hypothetical protein B0H63DRAFT_522537 [Podospora didyma]|uniref:Scytalone dehydratase-like protein Arp1 N-terminal domain-containing protein n=1 Tax=Podospora didyma TaxID=330526 RepID=A0AAE0TZL5_9PEZI|nr:hypothetical protein B0H63DRAFT_522537 [Podospora didyma]